MKAYVCDGKVFLANDITIIARNKAGKIICFEAPTDYRKRTLEKQKKAKLKAREILRKYSKPKVVETEVDVPQWLRNLADSSPEVEMSSWERDHVVSEINTNLSDEAKKLPIVTKDIGDFSYTFINFGFNNYYFIEKVPISSLPTVKEMRERVDEKKNN